MVPLRALPCLRPSASVSTGSCSLWSRRRGLTGSPGRVRSPLAPPVVPKPPLTAPPHLSPQEQFEFALTAVAEEVNAILKALPQ